MYFKTVIFAVCFICIGCKSKNTEKEQTVQYQYLKYENGNIKRLGMKIDSIAQGLWIDFFPDGKIRHFNFSFNGKDSGPFVGFYKNGRMRFYWFANEKGQIHGETKSFYDNGQIWQESFYINGSIHGISKRYSKTGEIEYIWEYNMGEFVRTIQGYDPDSEEEEEAFLKNIIDDDDIEE